jgi:hypothetical protein
VPTSACNRSSAGSALIEAMTLSGWLATTSSLASLSVAGLPSRAV